MPNKDLVPRLTFSTTSGKLLALFFYVCFSSCALPVGEATIQSDPNVAMQSQGREVSKPGGT